MSFLRLLSILAVLLFAATAGAAVDLTKIERKIHKEPAYHHQPKYCLLVFGPEAKTRLWLVQDGDTLYVDRNGDGDLTAADEKVAAEKDSDSKEGTFSFKVGEVRDGKLRHKELSLYVAKIDHLAAQNESIKALLKKNPTARGYLLAVEVEMPGRKGGGVGGRVVQRASYDDVNGVLQFADRPADAPILHFGGPWQVTLCGKQQLTINRETDVILGVGSPGVGPGTFTWIDYENVIPADKYPTLDVVYPPSKPGEKPLREHYELKKRC